MHHMVIPDIAKVVEWAKAGIKTSDDEERLSFYRIGVRLLLWETDGHLVKNRDMVECLVNEQRKTVHPFPFPSKLTDC